MYQLTHEGKETVQGLIDRYGSKREAMRKTYSRHFNLQGPHIYTLIVMSEQTLPWKENDLITLQKKGPHWAKPAYMEGSAVFFDAEKTIEDLLLSRLIEDVEDFELCEKCQKYHLAGHPCKT